MAHPELIRHPCPQVIAINDFIDYNEIIAKGVGCTVASLTIRNLEEHLKEDLRVRAAQHGRSMEEEARQILRQVLAPAMPSGSLSERIQRRFAALDADKLPVPARRPSRPPPQWDE